MKALIALSLILTMTSLASFQAKAEDEFNQEITEGKIKAAHELWMKDLEKDVNEKQQKALSLLALLSNDSREGVEYKKVGFSARLQGLREERAELAQKGLQADYATLQNYSKRLEALIFDLQETLK